MIEFTSSQFLPNRLILTIGAEREIVFYLGKMLVLLVIEIAHEQTPNPKAWVSNPSRTSMGAGMKLPMTLVSTWNNITGITH